MNNNQNLTENIIATEKIYRIDKFIVSAPARTELLSAINKTHHFLREQPGFNQDFIFEQTINLEYSQIVTMVEWENESFVSNAKEKVLTMQHQENYNPKEIIERNNIKAEFSVFKRLFL